MNGGVSESIHSQAHPKPTGRFFSEQSIKAIVEAVHAFKKHAAAIVLTLLLLWFLASQVVILTQGWVLYQDTADRMEGRGE